MLKGTLTNVTIIVIAAILAYYLAGPLQVFYCANIGICSGGFFGFDLSIVLWLSYTYVFLVTFILTSAGHRLRYWWIGVALIPILLFEILIDPPHIYFPIILGLVAWGLGYGANKALWKIAPGFMAKLQ